MMMGGATLLYAGNMIGGVSAFDLSSGRLGTNGIMESETDAV